MLRGSFGPGWSETRMESIENQVFDSVVVTIDGRAFVRCMLINCELRYSGGEFRMIDTVVNDCHWAFGGPARRTMEVLSKFNVLGDEQAALGPESASPCLPVTVNCGNRTAGATPRKSWAAGGASVPASRTPHQPGVAKQPWPRS